MAQTNGTHDTLPSLQPFTGAKRLRQLLSNPDYTLALPGIYDGLTARIALATGFEALYMTGAGTSLSRLGMADLGLATQTDMIANVAMICSLSPSTPVIADADTGYGSPVQVARTVMAYARAGCAALHIEDQVDQKRCGHLLGKQLVERDVWYSKLRAAVMARDRLGSEMMIIARTDARQSFGFEEAIERCRGAARSGVDVLFFEAITSTDEARKVIEEVRKLEKEVGRSLPVLLNVVAGGETPELTVKEAREVGFRIVIFPMACMDPVINACTESLAKLKQSGKSAGGPGVKRAFNLCALQECMEVDRVAGGKAYDSVGN